METFDLSECYTKLDQKELLHTMSRMINRAFTGHPILAITVSQDSAQTSGRWIPSIQHKLPGEITYTSSELSQDVRFLVSNAYIEWLGYA